MVSQEAVHLPRAKATNEIANDCDHICMVSDSKTALFYVHVLMYTCITM